LIAKHSLNEDGIWMVYGEDPNCDFGGNHHTPYLATLSGKLIDCITEAVEMGGFWQWGSGGHLVKIKVREVGAHVHLGENI